MANISGLLGVFFAAAGLYSAWLLIRHGGDLQFFLYTLVALSLGQQGLAAFFKKTELTQCKCTGCGYQWVRHAEKA